MGNLILSMLLVGVQCLRLKRFGRSDLRVASRNMLLKNCVWQAFACEGYGSCKQVGGNVIL
jgi:hypothetical protein